MRRTSLFSFLLMLLASVVVNGCKPSTPPAETPLSTAKPPPSASAAGTSWSNSLGMTFQPVPGVTGMLMAAWETRVQDFAAFVDATGHDATGNFYYYKDRSWKTGKHNWRDPGFEQTGEHPVVGVSWRDAVAFCLWLTTEERSKGLISPQQAYRLPTDEEWTLAAGKGIEGAQLPFNYANYHPLLDIDTYEFTSPAGSFPPNEHGFYDLAGNAWEYCLDLQSERDNFRVIRGGCWQNWHARFVGVQARGYCGPDVRLTLYGFRVVLTAEDRQMQSMKQDFDRHDPPPQITVEW